MPLAVLPTDWSNVAYSATSTVNSTALSARPGRQGFIIYNDSASDLYVKFGTTAASNSYTYKVPSQQALEHPIFGVVYNGRVDVILAAGTGNIAVTEF